MPRGHHSPVLARERILTILLENEDAQRAETAPVPEYGDLDAAGTKTDLLIAGGDRDAPASGLRQKQLTEILRVNASSMSEFIGHLEEDGYVERNVDPTDKRATLISLTEKGRARACELQDERAEKLADLFDPLTEEEKQELFRLLRKLQCRK